MKVRPSSTQAREAGFTTIELLVVVAIIAMMAAMALPAIGRYIRVYKIQSATQQVAGEIQTARLKAIGRNVNQGVVFVIWSPTTYQWMMEDLPSANPPSPPPSPPPCPPPGTIGTGWTAPMAMNDCRALHGTIRTLPNNISFDAAPAGLTANYCAFRFTRLGQWEGPTGPGPGLPREPLPVCTSAQTFIVNAPGGATVGVRENNTGLHSTLVVSSGGRVQVIRHW